MTLASDQAGFAKDFEVLRQGRLRDGFIAYFQEVGAILRTALGDDVREHRYPYRVRQGVEDTFYGYFLDRRVKEGPHNYIE